MISKTIYTIIFLFGLHLHAQSFSNINDCSTKIQGGVDGFPWSYARPFPWDNIQGIWQMKAGDEPLYLKIQMSYKSKNLRFLNLEIANSLMCTNQVAKGRGYMSLSERNVVRASITDGSTKYQMKLALFDAKDLLSDTYGCEKNILAASVQVIGARFPNSSYAGHSESDIQSENIMLKKISDDLGSTCKKSGAH